MFLPTLKCKTFTPANAIHSTVVLVSNERWKKSVPPWCSCWWVLFEVHTDEGGAAVSPVQLAQPKQQALAVTAHKN
jgi:hypothetical protein